MAKLIVARAATGKTAHCIDAIERVLRASPLSGVRVIVPDAIQEYYFRRRLLARGGCVSVSIGTFETFYHDILEAAGTPMPVATGALARRLVGAAIGDVAERGDLRHFESLRDVPGLSQIMFERISELERAGVTPEAYWAEVAHGPRYLVELGLVYEAYLERLESTGWTDADGLGQRAVQAIERRRGLLAGWSLVVVDGFDDFVVTQRRALVAIDACSPELLVTLPGEPSSGRKAFVQFENTRRALADLAVGFEPEPLTGSPHLPDAIAHLERQLFEPEREEAEAGPAIDRIVPRSVPEEAREAVRWIKARHIRDGIALDEMVIVTPEPERYRPPLREAAREMGVPLHFTAGDAIASSPPIAALLNLLTLPEQDYPRRPLIAAVRSPHLGLEAFGLRRQDAGALDSAARYGQVIGGLRTQWIPELERLASRSETERDDREEDRYPDLPDPDEAGRLRDALVQLAAELEPMQEGSVTQWIDWLANLLDELDFGNDDEMSEEDRSALDALRWQMRMLVVGEQLVGDLRLEYTGFLRELSGVLEESALVPRPPKDQRCVLVARVLEARGPRFKAVALLGLVEGQFPRSEREDPMLDEDLRERLGVEQRLGRAQEALYYQVTTRADDKLLLSHPRITSEGRQVVPSPFWNESESLLSGLAEEFRAYDIRPLEDAASDEELIFWMTIGRGHLAGFADELADGESRRLLRGRRVLMQRLGTDGSHSSFDGDLVNLARVRGDGFVPRYWSPSRFETYASCPMRFFASYVIGLQEVDEPTVGLTPATKGNILHGVLEEAYLRVRDAGRDTADLALVEESIRSIAPAAFARAPGKYGFRPSVLWELEQEQLLETMLATVRGIDELGGDWMPIGFEVSFHERNSTALPIQIDGESVLLHGIIDRVDVDSSGNVRVIDYKTGRGNLEKRDLLEGTRIQLPIYALAARDALGLGEPVEGLYWAMLAAEAGRLQLSTFSAEIDGEHFEGPEGTYELARRHVGRVLAGVRAGDFRPRAPRQGCPDYCVAATWCWQYVRKRW